MFGVQAVGWHRARQRQGLRRWRGGPAGTRQRFAISRHAPQRAQRPVGRAEQRHAAGADGLGEEGLHRRGVAGQHQQRGLGRACQRRHDVLGLVALRDHGADRDAEHAAADGRVGQHGVDQLADQAGLAHADGGVVERVLGHRIARQQGRERGGRRRRKRRQRQADVVGEVQREVLHRPGAGDEGRAARGRHRVAQQHGAGVEELVQRVHQHHGLALEQGAGAGVVASQRAGVRGRGVARAGAAPRHQQHDGLAGETRLAREREEELRAADLLGVERDDANLRLGQVVREDILHRDRGLVAGGADTGHDQAAAEEGVAQVGRHRPALRQHADAGPALGALHRQRLEGQRHGVLVIGVAHAVGAEQQHAGLARQVAQLLLARATLFARLGIARGEEHRAAATARGQAAQRLQHPGLGDGEHGQVQPLGQFIDRLHAVAPLDLRAAAADQVQRPWIAEAQQVAEHEAAEGARVGRGADQGDRARAQQGVQGTGSVVGREDVQCLHNRSLAYQTRLSIHQKHETGCQSRRILFVGQTRKVYTCRAKSLQNNALSRFQRAVAVRVMMEPRTFPNVCHKLSVAFFVS